jgi:HlyD family secretion protein
MLIVAASAAALLTLGVAGFALRGTGDHGPLNLSESAVVRRGSFEVSFPFSGELAALRQIDIRNKVDGRSTITEIVSEGTLVKPGDVVLRLNDDEIRAELREAQAQLIDAEAALNTAEAELAIAQITRTAELSKADTAVHLADLALKAWVQGEDPTMRQEKTLALEMAEKDFARLEARFAESAKLLEKKFISLDEYKKDEIALIEARAKLQQAQLDVQVYEQYQAAHDRAEKESELAQAQSERERVEKQHDAEVRSAEIEVNSKKLQLDTAKEELAEEQEQLSYCVVTAPSAGLVVYYSSMQQGMGGRNDGRPPQVGTELTKNEAVMIIPDTSQMIASVKVSEARSGMIRPGQRATIIADANTAVPLTGEVYSVGVLAESGGWRDPNRRDYTVKILIKNGQGLGLKPSMRCTAEVFVGRVSDALYVPIQALFHTGAVTYVYVPQGGGYAQKQVTIGRASDLYIEIKEGLNEGETVLLREPAPEEIVYRLPAPAQKEEEVAAEDIGEAPEMPTNALPPGLRGTGGTGGPSGPEGQGNGPGAQGGERGMPAGGRPQRGQGERGENDGATTGDDKASGGPPGGGRRPGGRGEGRPPAGVDNAGESDEAGEQRPRNRQPRGENEGTDSDNKAPAAPATGG